MAIILKASYRTVLTQAGPSNHQFSLSLRTKVADLTQVKSESARLYALLQSSLDNTIRNNGSVSQNRNTDGEWHHSRIRPHQRDQNHRTWACGRKQKKLLLRFIADYNLNWSTIERLAQHSGRYNTKVLTRCSTLYIDCQRHYALVLRIDGEFQKFGDEGIERTRRSKRDRYIGAEVIIPEAVWRDRSRNELRDYLARQVRVALQCCVARLRKDKESVDEARLFTGIDAAIAEFAQIDYDGGAEPGASGNSRRAARSTGL